MAVNSTSSKSEKIIDIPGDNAPTIGTASGSGSNKASVAFTAGSSTGVGGLTLSYTITSNPGSFTATGTTSPITITGLSNGTAYTFTAANANPSGAGAVSAASNSVTPAQVGFLGLIMSPSGNSMKYINGARTTTDSSGNIYLTGYGYNSANGQEGVVMKFSSTGTFTWARNFYDNATAASRAISQKVQVGVDSTGNVYVAGQYINASARAQPFVIKYNSSGTVQWNVGLGNSIGANQYDTNYGLAIDAADNVIVTNAIKNSSAGLNAQIMKIAAAGTITWQRKLNSSQTAANQGDYADSCASDSSSNTYIGGYSYNGSVYGNGFLAKYNSSGTIQWQRKISTSSTTSISGIAVDSSGNVFGVGKGANASGGTTAFIGKWNSAGTIQWQRTLTGNGAAASTQTWATNCALDSSGNLYVSGLDAVSNVYGWVAKYNTSGTIQWQRTIKNVGTTPGTSPYGIVCSGTNVAISGDTTLGDPTYGVNGFVLVVPQDGTLTGTYNTTSPLNTASGIKYEASSLTDATSTWTEAVGGFTDTATTSTLSTYMTDAAVIFQNQTVLI